MQGPLGRLAPPDDRHVRRYGLTTATMPSQPVPVLIGINWYENFDTPVKGADGSWWIGRGEWGSVRGGHAIVGCSPLHRDRFQWKLAYHQQYDGPCGGYAGSRMMSMLNRRLYDGLSLYRAGQAVDDWEGGEPLYYGTSVRAICDVLRTQGAWPVRRQAGGKTVPGAARLADGIAQNRWAASAAEIAAVLGLPEGQGWIELANSWGAAYPNVRISLEGINRLLSEDGECALVTDRPGAANV
jgi:hypothetical protein